MPSGARQRLFLAHGKLRSGWRLLLFVVLFTALVLLARFLVRLAPPPPLHLELFWQGLALLAAALGAGWLLLARLDRRPPGALGFAWTSATPRELLRGLAVGVVSLGAVAASLTAAGALHYRQEAGTSTAYLAALAGSLLLLAPAAAAEEAVFRGYPFQVLVEGVGPLLATLLASAGFALVHVSNPEASPLALLNIFLAGVLLSLAYLRTRSLWFASALHLGWNWVLASPLDLPVSGLDLFDTPLYDAAAAGPRWITGGAFGPEGGLAGTVATLVAIWAVWRLPGLGEAPEMQALQPLVDSRLAPAAKGRAA